MIHNKFLTTYYFTKFLPINIIIATIVLSLGAMMQVKDYIMFLYLFFMFGWVVYAKINFELQRVYAGIGATLLVVFIARLLIPVAIRNGVGVFGKIDPNVAKSYSDAVTSNNTIMMFSLIGILGVFFLIIDMYVAVSKMSKRIDPDLV